MVDFRDVLSSGLHGEQRLEVSGAILGVGRSRTRLPRNFTPRFLTEARVAYGTYEFYEAAHWERGKLYRWGIPKGYSQTLAMGVDYWGRTVAAAWRGEPAKGDMDIFTYQQGKLQLLHSKIYIGTDHIVDQGFDVWQWDTNGVVRLPAPKEFQFGVALPGSHPNEYIGMVTRIDRRMICHWDRGRYTILPLPKGAIAATAGGVSEQGWIVGHAGTGWPPTDRSFLWYEGQPLLLENCTNSKGWRFGEVFGITPKGVIFLSATKDVDPTRVTIPSLLALYPV
ncbi:MAG: hypothetical protein QM758_12155 [Armatimonas sp.]